MHRLTCNQTDNCEWKIHASDLVFARRTFASFQRLNHVEQIIDMILAKKIAMKSSGKRESTIQ